MTLPKLSHKPPTPPLTHKHTHIPISVSATTGTLQKLEQITPLCACSHSDCCYIQIGFQVASCVLQRPMGYGPAHYTWGLLPKSTEACVQPVTPHPPPPTPPAPDWAAAAHILSAALNTPISTTNHYS